MPDGEIFTAPIEDSTQGHIYYEFSGHLPGTRGAGHPARIHRRGDPSRRPRTRARSSSRKFSTRTQAPRGLGEIGIGTNFGIQRHTKNILFDEKMGGTVHLAIGRAYEFTGGRNESAVHWDMIKDLRQDGALYLDGELIQQNGQFLI